MVQRYVFRLGPLDTPQVVDQHDEGKVLAVCPDMASALTIIDALDFAERYAQQCAFRELRDCEPAGRA